MFTYLFVCLSSQRWTVTDVTLAFKDAQVSPPFSRDGNDDTGDTDDTDDTDDRYDVGDRDF